jgi:hypothetical protein
MPPFVGPPPFAFPQALMASGGAGSRWRRAAFMGTVLWLLGCGNTTSKPGAATHAGGEAGSAVAAAGEGGDADAPAGGRAVGGSASVAGSASVGGTSGGASGGASSAGGDAAGAAGDPALANLPLPATCRALRGESTDRLCSVDVICDGVAQTTHCVRATGAWQCTCDPPKADRTYMIEGVEELDACAVGAGLCAPAGPGTAFDPGSCMLTKNELGIKVRPGSGAVETCTKQLRCDTSVPVDFAPGVHATMPQSGLIDCFRVGEPDANSSRVGVDCEASGSHGPLNYSVVGNGLASACGTVLEHYLAGTEPVFDGSKVCMLYADRESSACLEQETCFDAAPLSAEVNVVKAPSERYHACSFDLLDNLVCSCSFGSAAGDYAAMTYSLGPSSPPAQCSVSECTRDVLAEATGVGVCEAQADTLVADGDTCLESFTCNQPAKLAGRAVSISSLLNVRCERAPEGAFYCGCAAGEQSATFRAGAAATGADACDLARKGCPEHLALPLGPASTAGAPPDPLLGL